MPTRPWLAIVLLSITTLPALAASPLAGPREQGAIEMALALNKRLSPYTLSVQLDGGRLRLSGAVESTQDKALAEQIARAVVQDVPVQNDLSLSPALGEQPATRRAVAQRIDDATLTATILAKLSWNAPTTDSNLRVSTDTGVVTLTGRAQTAEAKLLAGTLAGNTDGVVRVNNLVSLGAASTQTTQAEAQAKVVDPDVSDAWVTSKVKASFLYDRNLDALSIDVATREGVVTLSGEVASSELKTQAVQVARSLKGVRGVDADLLKVALPAAG